MSCLPRSVRRQGQIADNIMQSTANLSSHLHTSSTRERESSFKSRGAFPTVQRWIFSLLASLSPPPLLKLRKDNFLSYLRDSPVSSVLSAPWNGKRPERPIRPGKAEFRILLKREREQKTFQKNVALRKSEECSRKDNVLMQLPSLSGWESTSSLFLSFFLSFSFQVPHMASLFPPFFLGSREP